MFDVRSQPEARPPTSKIQDRSRHVRIAAHVEAHRVAVGQPQDSPDFMRINKVVEDYATGHGARLVALADVLSTRVITSVRTDM